MVDKPRAHTVDEFETFIVLAENHDKLFELIDGEIVEKMPTENHGELAAWIATLLMNFVRPRKLGRVGVEVRHQMPTDRENSRLPDVSFISGKRASVKQGVVPQMPDLAIEIKSPDDKLKDLKDKAQYYLLNGTLMVWIMDYVKRLVIVLTPDDEDILTENEMLEGGDVLPGFKVLVKDIFADPLEE
jgi:Uma2 family endonuclease